MQRHQKGSAQQKYSVLVFRQLSDLVLKVPLLLLLREVGGNKIDGARIKRIASCIVALSELVHSLNDAPDVFEFENVDITAGKDFDVAASLVAVMLRYRVRSAQYR